MTAALLDADAAAHGDFWRERARAIDWLYGRINYEQVPPSRRGKQSLKLRRMHELAERLGFPGLSIPTVHIAGTKGKGSCAAMIASVLKAAGLRTGLFTSPHLDQIEERFCINGSPATPAEFVKLVQIVRPAVQAMDARSATSRHEMGPTFFEICTALALLQFELCKADVVVLEVGLGGRLDSTNICRPAVSLITSISYDHMRQLGTTLAEIAFEKAGILKPGIPVICGVQTSEPQTVIHRIAEQRASPLKQLGRDFAYAYHPGKMDEVGLRANDTFDFLPHVPGPLGAMPHLPLPLLGEHQAANAAVAVAALDELARQGCGIGSDAVRSGLGQVTLAARAEVVRINPTVILDTAHNVASIQALVEVVQTRFSVARRHLVFAATQEKDVAGMLTVLLPMFDTVRLARYTSNPRGVPVEELAGLVAQCLNNSPAVQRPEVTACNDPQAAWQEALDAAQPNDLVCVTGSFFLAAELRQAVGYRTPASDLATSVR